MPEKTATRPGQAVAKAKGKPRRATPTCGGLAPNSSSGTGEAAATMPKNNWSLWNKKKTKDGRVYYVNKLTRKASWSAGGLKDTWIPTKTADGIPYFYNSVTKKRRWTKPE